MKAHHNISISINSDWLYRMAPIDQYGDIDYTEGLQEWFETVSTIFNDDDLIVPCQELELYCSKDRARRRLERGAKHIARLYKRLCDGSLSFEHIDTEWGELEIHVKIVDDEDDVVGTLVLSLDDENLIDEDAFRDYE